MAAKTESIEELMNLSAEERARREKKADWEKKERRKAEATHIEKYRFFSHPLSSVVGEQHCDGFDPNKRKFETVQKAKEDHEHVIYR